MIDSGLKRKRKVFIVLLCADVALFLVALFLLEGPVRWILAVAMLAAGVSAIYTITALSRQITEEDGRE